MKSEIEIAQQRMEIAKTKAIEANEVGDGYERGIWEGDYRYWKRELERLERLHAK